MPNSPSKSHRGPNISQIISDKILKLIAYQLDVSTSDPADIISAAQLHKDKINWTHIGNSCNIQKHLARKHFNEVIKPRYESAGSIMDTSDRSEFTMFIATLLSNRCYPSAEILARFAPTSGRKYSRVILRRAFHNVKKCRMLRDCYANLGYTFNDLLSNTNDQEQHKSINASDDGSLRLSFLTDANLTNNYAATEGEQGNLFQQKNIPPLLGPRAASSSGFSSAMMPWASMNHPKFMSSSLPSLSTKHQYINRQVDGGSPQGFTVLANLSGSPVPQYTVDVSYNVMRSLPIAPLQQQPIRNIMPAYPLSYGASALANTSSLELSLEHDIECNVIAKDTGSSYNTLHANTMPIFGDSGGYCSSTFSSWESNDQPCTMSSAPSPHNSCSTLPSLQAQATWTKPPIPITPNQIADLSYTLDMPIASAYSTSASSSTSVCNSDYLTNNSSTLPTFDLKTPTQDEATYDILHQPISEEPKEGTWSPHDNSSIRYDPHYTALAHQNYTELSSVSSDIFMNLSCAKCNTPECIQEDKKIHSNTGIVINDPFSLNEDKTSAFV